jgi:hypothetical protein
VLKLNFILVALVFAGLYPCLLLKMSLVTGGCTLTNIPQNATACFQRRESVRLVNLQVGHHDLLDV